MGMRKFDLVIVRVDRIGDYVIWHDALVAYRKRYAGKKVLLVCVGSIKSIVEQEELFTEIFTYNHDKAIHSISYLLSLIRQLHSFSANTIIYPLWTRNIIGDIFVSSIKADEKIGMKGTSDGKFTFRNVMRNIFNLSYTKLIENPKTKNEIRAVEYFTKQVVDADYKYGYNKLSVKTELPIISNKYVVIALSASNELRIWRMENFVKVINEIPDEYDIVLSGYGIDDEKRAELVISKVANRKHIINMVGKTSILQLVALISKASFIIGNDSSAVHIAAASRVPSICILPGAHFNRFVPYPEDMPESRYNPLAVYYKMDCFGCNYKCKKPINGVYECLEKITVDMVNEKVNQLLKELSYGRTN